VDDIGRVRCATLYYGAASAWEEAIADFRCRYLILPGLYAKDPQLKFSQAVLSVFVVALLTAGYSFTALLCFACRNEMFQAEAVFLY
jgi:hypothetical protein